MFLVTWVKDIDERNYVKHFLKLKIEKTELPRKYCKKKDSLNFDNPSVWGFGKLFGNFFFFFEINEYNVQQHSPNFCFFCKCDMFWYISDSQNLLVVFEGGFSSRWSIQVPKSRPSGALFHAFNFCRRHFSRPIMPLPKTSMPFNLARDPAQSSFFLPLPISGIRRVCAPTFLFLLRISRMTRISVADWRVLSAAQPAACSAPVLLIGWFDRTQWLAYNFHRLPVLYLFTFFSSWRQWTECVPGLLVWFSLPMTCFYSLSAYCITLLGCPCCGFFVLFPQYFQFFRTVCLSLLSYRCIWRSALLEADPFEAGFFAAGRLTARQLRTRVLKGEWESHTNRLSFGSLFSLQTICSLFGLVHCSSGSVHNQLVWLKCLPPLRVFGQSSSQFRPSVWLPELCGCSGSS